MKVKPKYAGIDLRRVQIDFLLLTSASAKLLALMLGDDDTEELEDFSQTSSDLRLKMSVISRDDFLLSLVSNDISASFLASSMLPLEEVLIWGWPSCFMVQMKLGQCHQCTSSFTSLRIEFKILLRRWFLMQSINLIKTFFLHHLTFKSPLNLHREYVWSS